MTAKVVAQAAENAQSSPPFSSLGVSSLGVSLPVVSQERDAEAQLLARIRAGDQEASATLLRKHGGRMLAVARRLLRCEEDSADAVQDAFLAAFRSLDKFEGNSSLGTWLHRIVVNTCLTKLRAQSRSRAAALDELLPKFDETGHHTRPVHRWEEEAVSQLTREETRMQVRACIDQLPEAYRTVLLLRDIEELDTNQTAHHLGITAATVKTRLHRARQALRTLLEPLFGPRAPGHGLELEGGRTCRKTFRSQL
jgi:RNA polymerase sigma-70 factor (ECF subfamily)